MRHGLTAQLDDVLATPRGLTVVGVLALAALGGAVASITAAMDALWAAAFVVALIFGGALLRWPWLGVVFIFTTNLFKYPEFVYRMPISPNRLVSGVLLLLLLVAIATRQRIDFVRSPVFLGFTVVIALLVANVMLVGGEEAPERLAALDLTDRTLSRTLAQFLFLILFGAFIRTRRQLLVIVGVFLLALVITVPGALSHTYDLTAQGQQGLERARAAAVGGGIQSAENANRLAFVAVLGISFLWFGMQHYRTPLLRLAAWLLMPALVLTVFLSGSRSGVLNLGLLVALLALQSGIKPSRLVAVACIAVIAVGLVYFVVPQPIIDRITTFGASQESTSATRSIELREVMLGLGAKLFSTSPLTGVGVGNVRWMTALEPSSGGVPLTMHNAYMLVLVEGGIFFLGAYLLLFYLTWRSLRQAALLSEALPHVGLGWLVQATRVNLVLLLSFSLFAEAWNEFPFLLTVCSAMVLTVLYGGGRATRVAAGAR